MASHAERTEDPVEVMSPAVGRDADLSSRPCRIRSCISQLDPAAFELWRREWAARAASYAILPHGPINTRLQL